VQAAEVNPKGTVCESLAWTYLAHEQIGKWAFVNMVKKFGIPHLGDRSGTTVTKQ